MLTKEEQDKLYQQLGDSIKTHRNQANMSQDELAKQLGFSSRISIVNIESGKQRIQLHTLIEITELFKIPVVSIIPSLDMVKKIEVSNDVKKSLAKETSNAEVITKVTGFYHLTKKKNQ